MSTSSLKNCLSVTLYCVVDTLRFSSNLKLGAVAKWKDREWKMLNQCWPAANLLLTPLCHYTCERHCPNWPCPTAVPLPKTCGSDPSKANHLYPADVQTCYWHTCSQAEYTLQLHWEQGLCFTGTLQPHAVILLDKWPERSCPAQSKASSSPGNLFCPIFFNGLWKKDCVGL